VSNILRVSLVAYPLMVQLSLQQACVVDLVVIEQMLTFRVLCQPPVVNPLAIIYIVVINRLAVGWCICDSCTPAGLFASLPGTTPLGDTGDDVAQPIDRW
jgi:hypothetical protein